MADLTKKCGNMYPSSDIKDATAKALVEFFPCLALIRPGVSSHCHFYNNKTGGFFDNRLKTMRKSMSPSKRKRKPSKSQKNTRAVNSNQQRNLLVEEDTLIKIRWLQTHPAIPQNRGTITQYMSDTFAARQAMIESELTTFTLIVEKFPRFVDFNNGALIFTDFATTYPMVQSFEENFVVKLGNKIERLARRDKVELPVETSDRCLNLLMMAFLLFPAIKKIKRESLTKLMGRFLYFEKNLLSSVRNAYRSHFCYVCCPGPMTFRCHFFK
ncbi:uncharacterized protein LOC116931782 isoform X2 [Daphnia magna]|uniref:uncharacterized protein LOC116931782 isoform X2 n=1 Tax=Daphnia magna TaxID=35525 RepID=UPI001E1BD263|nr:uncharacterized protein LOC116931782 isoform X2 [Daphnia magna]